MSDVVGLDRSADGLRTPLPPGDADAAVAAASAAAAVIDELRAEIATLRDKIDRLKEENNDAKEHYRVKAERSVNEVKSFLQCLMIKKDDLDAQLAAANSNALKTQEALKERDAELKSLREQAAKLEAECQTLREKDKERLKLRSDFDQARASSTFLLGLVSKLEVAIDAKVLASLVHTSLAADALDVPDAKIGPLWSLSPKRKTWKQRHVVLRDNLLFCYSAARKEAPKIVLALSSPVVDEVPKSRVPRDFCFRVQPSSSSKAETLLCANDEVDKQDWMNRIRGAAKWWERLKLSAST